MARMKWVNQNLESSILPASTNRAKQMVLQKELSATDEIHMMGSKPGLAKPQNPYMRLTEDNIFHSGKHQDNLHIRSRNNEWIRENHAFEHKPWN